MDFYTLSSERYAFGQYPHHQHPSHIQPYGDSYVSQPFHEGVPHMYSALPPYYPTASQYLPYANPPAFNQSPNTLYYPSHAVGSNAPLEYSQEVPPPVQIHAPVPLSAYTSLLPGTPESASQPTPRPSAVPSPTDSTSHLPTGAGTLVHEKSPLDQYMNAPSVTFPTPCDLLNELSSQVKVGCGGLPSGRHARPPLLAGPSSASDAKPKPERKQSEKKPENQRKAYFRSVAENVGFQPTNPDSITSHDKKRHYLECLEQYVLWLHEELRLVGKEPVPLERVPEYRGLDSRSIRMLLVHMQGQTRRLNENIVAEEHRFLELREQVVAYQEGSLDPHTLDARRHSIASGAISAAAVATSGYQT